MDADALQASGYIALVVRLQAADDGLWYLYVHGTTQKQIIPLMPISLVVRLWRNSDTGMLRGLIGRQGSDQWVPFQSNHYLEEFVREWLSGGSASGTG